MIHRLKQIIIIIFAKNEADACAKQEHGYIQAHGICLYQIYIKELVPNNKIRIITNN